MSKIEVDQVDPQSGTTVTLGTSGDTVSIPSGVTLANAGTVTGIPTSSLTGTISTAQIADDAVTLGKMAPGTDGNIISYDASGNPVAVATGSAGQVLTSAGAGAPPTFAEAGGGGFEFISNTALSNAGTLDINSVFSSTYQNYRIIGSGINMADNNNRLEMQLRTTSAVTTSAYYWTGVGQRGNGNAVDDGDQNTTAWRIITNSANTGQAINFDMTVYRPQAGLYTSFTSLCAGRRNGGDAQNLFSGGYQNTTNSYTGFRLFFETGNLSAGNVTVFGIKDS